jgi:hypothetical protein
MVLSSFIGQGWEIDICNSRFDVGSTDTLTGGGTGRPNGARKAMNAAREVNEDGPLVTVAEPQPLQGKFTYQAVC